MFGSFSIVGADALHADDTMAIRARISNFIFIISLPLRAWIGSDNNGLLNEA